MSIFIKFKSFARGLSYFFVIIGFCGLSLESKGQVPNSRGKVHTIDKSKLSIHENFRDEQPQRFSNDKSRIVAFAANTKRNYRPTAVKNAPVHSKEHSTTPQKVSMIKGFQKTEATKVEHHKIKRKLKKSH